MFFNQMKYLKKLKYNAKIKSKQINRMKADEAKR